MQNYETMYILQPNLLEEQINEAVNKYSGFLSERGAENIEITSLGKKRLAYEIAGYSDGIYIQMNYQADGSQIAPMERAMRLSEEVIRYLTLKTKSNEPLGKVELEETEEEGVA